MDYIRVNLRDRELDAILPLSPVHMPGPTPDHRTHDHQTQDYSVGTLDDAPPIGNLTNTVVPNPGDEVTSQ